MSGIEVRIIRLEPMRVASLHGFGEQPETEAWDKLQSWAGPQGLLDNPERHRVFGFNNPNPSAGSPNYGYELWIEVGPDAVPEGEVEIVDFDGGLYAVARCKVPVGQAGTYIPATWQKLVAWRENSSYKGACHQWLEKSIPVDLPGIEFVLDLYLPIAE